MIPGYSSILVADYILRRAAVASIGLTQFQIIKQTFIAHGRHLAVTGKPLILDRIEAWKHGPVIPVLYQALKVYGNGPVPAFSYCGTPASSDERDEFFKNTLPDQARSIIEGVVRDYGDWSVSEIYQLCHEPGTPWKTCYTGEYGVEIPDSVIQQYYESQMA